MNLQTIFDKLTSNDIICYSKIEPYKKSLETLLKNYYDNRLDEVFYHSDSYGVTIEILNDPNEDCLYSYNLLTEVYNEEEYQEFKENYFCYVSTLDRLF